MNVSLVYDGKTLTLPPEVGTPLPHQMQSTPLDNLVELSGRICYDSVGNAKTRDTAAYHEHIHEVNHGSVQEHANLVFQIDVDEFGGSFDVRPHLLEECLNRPGVATHLTNGYLRITANARAINEWHKFGTMPVLAPYLQGLAAGLMPHAIRPTESGKRFETDAVVITTPMSPAEQWRSFYIGGVSRNLTHELVRHKWRTAISQRSTRYVDEGESAYAYHPLINKFVQPNDPIDVCCFNGISLSSIEKVTKSAYQAIVKTIEDGLIADGVSKFSARKQARGAARGVLSSHLSTELIFSASLDQWVRIICMRATGAADAEIRLMGNRVFEELVHTRDLDEDGFTIARPDDGIGYEVVIKSEYARDLH